MTISKKEFIELASNSNDESDLLDFKREFAPEKKAAFWAETVKDLVSFANTRGGIIVFGILDDGSDSEIDCSKLFEFDDASLIDQVRKYTGSNFTGMSVVVVTRGGKEFPAILVETVETPLVFTKVGTYEVQDGKQKTAFSLGTIYFRHGSKSEPCTQADIENVIKRRLNETRDEWLGNIRKVVEADPGAAVIVANPHSAQGAVQITSDPTAPLIRIPKLSDGFPYKQSEVISQLNDRLNVEPILNTHDIQAIKLFEEIDEESRPDLMSKPHANSSPQYSKAFVDLIFDRRSTNEKYLLECRAHWKKKTY